MAPFEWTLGFMAEMRETAPAVLQHVLDKVGVTESEFADWERMAQEMKIPADPESGILEQHDGFFQLPHLDIDTIPATDFPLYHNWPLVKIYRHDMIKQPDSMLLQLFFSQDFSLESKTVNYEYYEPRCVHESSLSPSVHSIMASEIGRRQDALDFSASPHDWMWMTTTATPGRVCTPGPSLRHG